MELRSLPFYVFSSSSQVLCKERKSVLGTQVGRFEDEWFLL